MTPNFEADVKLATNCLRLVLQGSEVKLEIRKRSLKQVNQTEYFAVVVVVVVVVVVETIPSFSVVSHISNTVFQDIAAIYHVE